ncbi:Protein HIGH CHLOROPHYLL FLUORESCENCE PHENOTYPE 244, chloroplastic, partial [Cucurbita argyrosperma subsp. sororia]
MEPKKVAIIGAGISGLAACKFTPNVFEPRGGIGGVWTEETTALQTSKELFQFSDFPWPKSHIRFNVRVLSIDYEGCSDEEIEGWTLWGGAGDAFAERRKWRLNVVDARTNVPLEVRSPKYSTMALRLPTQLAKPGEFHWRHRDAFSSRRAIAATDALFSTFPSSASPCASSSSGRSCLLPVVRCTAQQTGPVNLAPGTPVRPTSILVVGATGTLGRQIVRRALDEGYEVRCLVRPRPAPADFLRDWGAIVVNADLSKPETIPATLVGIHTIIDCATGRPEEPIKTVDWEGKVALIQCAKAMGIQKYIFFSIHNCDKHPEVPLMEIKYCTEKFLKDAGLNHIVIRLCGFMQGLIGQYAVPILEEKSVWGTDAPTRIAYMDTQDIARLTFIALRNENINGKLLTFAGPRAWTTQEVITLCERLAGQDANVTTVPVSVLRFTRQLTRFFEWTNDVADRLAFSEVLTSDTVFSVPMAETYNLLDCLIPSKYFKEISLAMVMTERGCLESPAHNLSAIPKRLQLKCGNKVRWCGAEVNELEN